jgi:uncharacterized membrane protein
LEEETMGFINTLLHHPLHPMFVHFPIGLTGGAFFFILCALIWPRIKILEQIAFANIALAVPATVVAGILGIYDNIHNYSGRAANHQYKIILAILLFLVVTATSLLRWRKPGLFENKATKWWYSGAYLVSFAIATVLGFLGGIIVFGP